MHLNAVDSLLLVLVALLVLVGLLKGLTRLLIGIGALVVAFILAARFHALAAEAVVGATDMEGPVANLAGYFAIFLGTMLAGALIGRIMRGALKVAMLGWVDRLAGAGAGLVAAQLLAVSLILPVVSYLPPGERLLRDSVLAPYVAVFADVASSLGPEELGEQYRERMDALRQYWRSANVTDPPIEEDEPADPRP